MIVVRRTYVPRPGQGGKLLSLLREAGAAMRAAGFDAPTLYRGWHGNHGTIYTEQKWESVIDYEESRGVVRKTPTITTVFDQIYPVLSQTHHTEILELVE